MNAPVHHKITTNGLLQQRPAGIREVSALRQYPEVPCPKGMVTQAKRYWAKRARAVKTSLSSDVRFDCGQNGKPNSKKGIHEY
jgi:hypothetical protein